MTPAAATPLQRREAAPTGAAADDDPFAIHLLAEQGVAGASAPLPYLDDLKSSFGRHGAALDGARAQIGGPAATAAAGMGAAAYATGDRVAFASSPDRALVAHEAAHLVQQRAGVSLKGGVGAAGDPYEQHADEVAAAFVSGGSAEAILDRFAGSSGAATTTMQRKESGPPSNHVELAMKIYAKGTKVREVASRFEELGKKLEELGHFRRDTNLVQAAKRVHEIASNTVEIWKSTQELFGEVSRTTELAADTLEKVGAVLEAIDAVSHITDRTALNAFLADPSNYDKGKAWATDVADTFSAAANLIPANIPGLPNFIPRILKGLLNAPATYVAAFLAIMDAYLAKVDAASGGTYDKAEHFGDGMDEEWVGPLTRLYMFAPTGLKHFMNAHRKNEGIDLWKADEKVSRAVLVSAVQREGGDDAPAWIKYIQSRAPELRLSPT